MTNKNYVVAKHVAGIDTRRSERLRAAQPAGPINGVCMRGSQDLLTAGDPICADDLEGGATELGRLVELGQVVSADGADQRRTLTSIAPKSGLYVAPGMTLNSRRGVHMPGSAVDANDFTATELENLIQRGTILRAGAAPTPSNPPEAA